MCKKQNVEDKTEIAAQVPFPQSRKKKYLEDVVILRLLLIFFLIWNHAFAPYSGHWNALPNQDDIPVYKWFVLVVYNMRIQSLIFISGYLLGYTSLRKQEAMGFNSCVVKKIKRLLVPSIIFSAIYYMIFYDTTRPISSIVYSIVNGCGHMWFLPMLFWCFVGVYLVEKLKITSPPVYVLVFAILLALLPLPAIPLRLNSACHYFVFFYLGFGIKRSYFKCLNPHYTLKPILMCIAIYCVAFVLNYFFSQNIINFSEGMIARVVDESMRSLIMKIAMLCLENFFGVIMSLSGLLAAFWSAHYFVVGKHKLPEWMIKLSTYCYGVYICQQFILKWFYYHTSLPDAVGTVALPWIALVLTLILSLFITHMLLKTRFGRYLIG